MNIGVDAGCLGITDERLQVGVYQVAKNVLEQLGKIDTTNEYLLYSFNPINPALMKQFGKRMKNSVVRPTLGWTKFALPVRLSRDHIDLFLGLNQSLPQRYSWQKKYKTVVLFYDLAFEHFPENYQESYQKMHEHSLFAATHADSILAISESTKQDIHTSYGISYSKITVSHLGIRNLKKSFYRDPLIRKTPLRCKDDVIEKLRIPYFLFVGAYKSGKNIPTLIRAFDQFLKMSDSPYDLVLVGGDKWLDPEIETVVNHLSESTKNQIKQLGFLPDAKLAALYSHACAFVSPSLYEGFGLGFVEAMQFGCPVIGSAIPTLREVIGDAGILVPATDVNALAGAMKQIVNDEKLKESFIEKGKKRSKGFSWEKFAHQVMKRY